MGKPSKLALEVAARCWCDKETKHLEMNVDLAKAFAKRLDKCLELMKLARDAHWTNPPYLELDKLITDFEKGKI